MTTTQLHTFLSRTREIISTSWTKGTYAKDSEGRSCIISSPDAKCFCLLGALRRTEYELGTDKTWYQARAIIANVLNTGRMGGIIDFNDNLSTTKADVLSLLDKAISSL
jgi:hypothetical protein